MTTTKKRPSRNGDSARVRAHVGLAAGSKGKGVEAVQAYLTRYGYLADPDASAAFTAGPAGSVASDQVGIIDARPVATPGVFDASTVDALRRFQAMAHLPVTGEFDAATKAKMADHRCGNADVANFVATGGRWPTTDLVYAFSEFSPDLSPAQCRQAIHQAFSTWAGFTGLTFREGPAASAQIIIRFVGGNHGDGNNFDGPSGVLAHAYFPPVPPANPIAIQGDTHFDEAETWTINVPPGAGTFDLTTVAIHEFGHALGLHHSPVPGSVMEAFYGGARRTLHSDDIAGIGSIYAGYAIAEASWTHGTSVQVEVPESLEVVRRMGFFTRIIGKPNSTNWLHFAVPTPVIENGVRRVVGPCMLRLATGGPNAVVRDVHIYDGEQRIAVHDSVNLSGQQPLARFGVAHAPQVLFGVGISVGVQFGGGSAAARTIDLISAGCDFRP